MALPTDPNSSSDTNDGQAEGSERGSPPKTPRWVKVFGIIAIVVIVLVAALLLISGGAHGPGRHTPGGGGNHTPPSHQR